MLEYNEVTLRKYIIYENEPYEVLESHVFRKQQRKPVNAVKLKNLISGRIVEHSYHVSDKVEEAEISKRDIKYIFTTKGQFWFCEINDPAQRFMIEESMIGNASKWLKPNSIIKAKIFEEKIFGLEIPIKMELKVIEAADAVRGDTAKSAGKMVKLETGAEILVPMFINQGETIVVNTDSGEYISRLS